MRNFLIRAVPFFTLALFLTVASVGAFSGGIWGVVGIGGAIIIFVSVWVIDRRPPLPDPWFAALAFGALAVLALSSLHSSQPPLSWFEVKRLSGVFLPLMLLSSPLIIHHIRSKHLVTLLPLAAYAGALALGLELFLDAPMLRMLKGSYAPLTEYNRGLSYLVILAFPIMAGMWVSGRRYLLMPFILILLIPASLTESRAAKLALLMGLAVAAAAYFKPRFTLNGLKATVPLLIGWPFVAQWFYLAHKDALAHFPPSWRDRMEIWDYLSYRILERPLLGWGPGTSRTLDYLSPHGMDYIFRHSAAPHPHNVVIQLWVEMGLPGLALGVLFAFFTLNRISKMDDELKIFALGAWMASLCLCLVAYNFWTDSLFAAFAIAGLAFALFKKA